MHDFFDPVKNIFHYYYWTVNNNNFYEFRFSIKTPALLTGEKIIEDIMDSLFWEDLVVADEDGK